MAISGKESVWQFLFTDLSYQFNNFFPWQVIALKLVCVCDFSGLHHTTFKATVFLLGNRKIADFIILHN